MHRLNRKLRSRPRLKQYNMQFSIIQLNGDSIQQWTKNNIQ